ncbi:MAG: family 4 glycosyl hydrolase [Planctomycetota bacterium]|jgi:alpha-galactosidase
MGKMKTIVASDGVEYEYIPFDKSKGTVGKKRIVFIGASYKFCHKVVRDMLLVGGFDDCEVVLLDLYKRPLEVVGDLIEKMIAQAGSRMKVSRTTDRAKALKRADICLLSITVGGVEADVRAAEVCGKYGIPVAVGDTLGPAALARNLRTLPVVLEIARDMERICPEAVLINFTNPLSCVTGVVLRETSVRTYGLCHSVEDLSTYFGKLYGCAGRDIEMTSGGVNHMSFITSVEVRGRERLSKLYEDTAGSGAGIVDSLLGRVETAEVQREIHRILGVWPSTGGEHAAEFFPEFLKGERRRALGLHVKKVRKGRKPFKPTKEPPAVILKWAYGDGPVEDMNMLTTEFAHELMWAVIKGDPNLRVVNVLNKGAIAGIAADACVEIWATITKKGERRERVQLPPACTALLSTWTTIHELSYRAALEGDRDAARAALLLDPHVADMGDIDGLFDDMVRRLGRWMPRFARKARPRKRRRALPSL